MQVSPYLMFNGQAEAAMNFYADVLGGQVTSIQRFGDAPMPADESIKNQVMHATVQAGDIHIMASDSGGKQEIRFGDNVHLSVNCASEEEINRVFAAMADGGEVTMPLDNTFWGARFGMLKDKFGVCWMFNWDRPGAKPE